MAGRLVTADRVAREFHGDCAGTYGWCDVHRAHWAYLVSPWCTRLLDFIDVAEQAVEADRARLRAGVEALPPEHHYGTEPSCVSRAAVLNLLVHQSGAGAP